MLSAVQSLENQLGFDGAKVDCVANRLGIGPVVELPGWLAWIQPVCIRSMFVSTHRKDKDSIINSCYIYCLVVIDSNKWPASREIGPSDITNSVDHDHPTYDVQNAYMLSKWLHSKKNMCH